VFYVFAYFIFIVSAISKHVMINSDECYILFSVFGGVDL